MQVKGVKLPPSPATQENPFGVRSPFRSPNATCRASLHFAWLALRRKMLWFSSFWLAQLWKPVAAAGLAPKDNQRATVISRAPATKKHTEMRSRGAGCERNTSPPLLDATLTAALAAGQGANCARCRPPATLQSRSVGAAFRARCGTHEGVQPGYDEQRVGHLHGRPHQRTTPSRP